MTVLHWNKQQRWAECYLISQGICSAVLASHEVELSARAAATSAAFALRVAAEVSQLRSAGQLHPLLLHFAATSLLQLHCGQAQQQREGFLSAEVSRENAPAGLLSSRLQFTLGVQCSWHLLLLALHAETVFRCML